MMDTHYVEKTPPVKADFQAAGFTDITDEEAQALTDLTNNFIVRAERLNARYAMFDKDFANVLRQNPDRLYVPLRIDPELANIGKELHDDFNYIARDFHDYYILGKQVDETDPFAKELTDSEIYEQYAKDVGEKYGVEDFTADELGQLLSLTSSFKHPLGGGLVDDIGNAEVMKMRHVGVGAFLREKDGMLEPVADFANLAASTSGFTKIINGMMAGVSGFKPIKNSL